MFFAKFNKSCLITYMGIVFGILSMYFSFEKIAFSDVIYTRYALICLIISGVCDMFDGKFARMCKRSDEEKEFGIQLDSLADTLCFLCCPIIFMLALNMTEWYHILSYSLLAICGVSRLGYFNIKADLDVAVNSYCGLPVTATAIIYPILGLLRNVVEINILVNVYFVTTIITAILFILSIKFPKFKGSFYYIVPVLAILLITLLLVL